MSNNSGNIIEKESHSNVGYFDDTCCFVRNKKTDYCSWQTYETLSMCIEDLECSVFNLNTRHVEWVNFDICALSNYSEIKERYYLHFCANARGVSDMVLCRLTENCSLRVSIDGADWKVLTVKALLQVLMESNTLNVEKLTGGYGGSDGTRTKVSIALMDTNAVQIWGGDVRSCVNSKMSFLTGGTRLTLLNVTRCIESSMPTIELVHPYNTVIWGVKPVVANPADYLLLTRRDIGIGNFGIFCSM